MRHRSLRARGLATDPRATIGKPTKTEDHERLEAAKLLINAEAGGTAPLLIGLIDRRADGALAFETAEFILKMWRSGGDDRARIVAHAMKSDERIALERRVQIQIRDALRPLAGKPPTVERMKDMKQLVVRELRANFPAIAMSRIKDAVSSSIESKDGRLSVRLDAIFALVDAPSSGATH